MATPINPSLQKNELQKAVGEISFWWHSIDLGQGVVTPGHKNPQRLKSEVDAMCLPDLHGKSVLDVGAWDGFFTFEAERRGAKRVLSLDHYVWSINYGDAISYQNACAARNEKAMSYDKVPHLWQPAHLPGKRGYDLAHKILGSKAEWKAADFITTTPEEIGTFDVTFFLGVLYHLENPFAALKWLASVTNELAVIETAMVAFPGYEQNAFAEFYEGTELLGDPTNWWAPNRNALEGMCRAAGFKHVEMVSWPWRDAQSLPQGAQRSRCVLHAWKQNRPVSVSHAVTPYEPLRATAFRAEITMDCPAIEGRPGSVASVSAKIKNVSTQTWEPAQKIGVSYHLLDANGELLRWDGPRTYISRSVSPNEELLLDCEVQLPDNLGTYMVEFDMLQEEVSWFKSHGSATREIPCRVCMEKPDLEKRNAIVASNRQAVESAVKEIGSGPWFYHKIDFGGGLVLRGYYEMDKYLPYYHIPRDLTGKTVLDIGTASGYFAMECAIRGASVTCVDIHDGLISAPLVTAMNLDVRYCKKSIYDLDANFGQFDLVICGSLLCHLPDLLGAIMKIRSVCKGRAIVATSATADSKTNPKSICDFVGEKATDGEYWCWWDVSATALKGMLLAAGFSTVENVEHYTLVADPETTPYAVPHVAMTAGV